MAAAQPSQMRQHTFSEELPDATLNFQIIDIGRQIYIWMSMGTPNLTQLAFGIQTAADSSPSVTSLLPDSVKSDTPSLAGRLATKLKRPVLCCCDIPNTAAMLQVLVHVANSGVAQRLAALDASGNGTDELRYSLIVSAVQLVQDAAAAAACEFSHVSAGEAAGEITVGVAKAAGAKCVRCWNYSAAVGGDAAHPELCERCGPVVSASGFRLPNIELAASPVPA